MLSKIILENLGDGWELVFSTPTVVTCEHIEKRHRVICMVRDGIYTVTALINEAGKTVIKNDDVAFTELPWHFSNIMAEVVVEEIGDDIMNDIHKTEKEIKINPIAVKDVTLRINGDEVKPFEEEQTTAKKLSFLFGD